MGCFAARYRWPVNVQRCDAASHRGVRVSRMMFIAQMGCGSGQVNEAS